MKEAERDMHDRFLRQFVEHEEALRWFVRSLVPTLEDAREVMQETAAVLWSKFESLDSDDNFRRWAFGVARFEALAYRRDKARDRHVFGEELLALLAEEAEVASEKDELEKEALRACLAKLPAAKRQLVVQAYEPGVRIDVLAEEMGRTAMSLYKALHRVRLTLADCIESSVQRAKFAE